VSLRLFLPFVFCVVSTLAQTFEAASVKRSAPEDNSGGRSTGVIPRQQDASRIRYPNVRLDGVIALAYGVDSDHVDGPQWLKEDRFDIEATLPENASPQDVPPMLRHLLTERFHMATHEELKQSSGWALVRTKGSFRGEKVASPSAVGFDVRDGQIRFEGTTLGGLSFFLSRQMGFPIVDETGIEGPYTLRFPHLSPILSPGIYRPRWQTSG
jgi:uncharacterized protein (TIGR03435 family)